jgi:23S rRNA (uracil1939-C5)-methyltransferase
MSTRPEAEKIITIDSVAYGGKGVGRRDGKVYFVEDSVPGDEVAVTISSDKERYADATVAEYKVRSTLRGPSPCAVSQSCGGCQWIEIDYATQLRWKQSFVDSALRRIGKLGDDFAVEILGSPKTLNYRNRVLLRLHFDGTNFTIGYFRRGTRELIQITGCHIAAPIINKTLSSIQSLATEGLQPFKARLELQEIYRENNEKAVVVTIYPGEGERCVIRDFATAIGQLPDVHWAGLVFDLSDAPTVLWDRDENIDFPTIPGQFQQVNMDLNRELRRLVREFVAKTSPARILDVFCGSGNLSLQLAAAGRYVEGVEFNKKAIVIAKRNASRHNLPSTTYIAGDGEAHLWKCDRAGETFDLVILDPPRQGMFKGMVPLRNIAPNYIIYVSCDPTTLARDLGYLCRKDFYTIERVVALDFFPNTYHVETVVFLRKNR